MPLVENGEDIEVTEDNKMKYLNLLAQHRLVRSVKEEIEAFLKGGLIRIILAGVMVVMVIYTFAGLNEIVPDNLLSMFDENELEVCLLD